MLPSTRQTLNDAADMIECFGWTQGNVINPREESCLAQTLVLAARKQATSSGAHQQFMWDAYSALYRYLGVYSVSEWNNASSRTKEQVLKVLRDCAKQ